MGKVERGAFVPDEATAAAYDELFDEYVRLHDHFGRGGNDVMKRLKALRRKAIASRRQGRTGSHSEPAGALGGEAA